MLRGAGEKKPEAEPEESDDPLELGAKALKKALGSGDPKEIAAAFRSMQAMCMDEYSDGDM